MTLGIPPTFGRTDQLRGPFCEWSMIWKVKKRHKPSNLSRDLKIAAIGNRYDSCHAPIATALPRIPGTQAMTF